MSFPLGSNRKPNRLSAKGARRAGLQVGQCDEGDQKNPSKFFKLKYVSSQVWNYQNCYQKMSRDACDVKILVSG